MIRGVVVIEGGPKKMKSLFGDFVKAEMQQLVRDWHEDTLPGHFVLGAARKYKYDTRSIPYQRRKRKMGMLPALVYSGESRDMLSRSIRITGTKTLAKGTMKAPRYFWMNPPGDPPKSEEMLRVTLKEVMAMAKLLNERVTTKLNQIKATEVFR